MMGCIAAGVAFAYVKFEMRHNNSPVLSVRAESRKPGNNVATGVPPASHSGTPMIHLNDGGIDTSCWASSFETYPPLSTQQQGVTLPALLRSAAELKTALKCAMYGIGSVAFWSSMELYNPSYTDQKTGQREEMTPYHRADYSCSLGLFNESGKLLDGRAGFDRLEDLYFFLINTGDQYHDCLLAQTMLEGSVLYKKDEVDNRLLQILWIKYDKVPPSASVKDLEVFDVDDDGMDEILLWAKYNPQAIVHTEEGLADLQEWGLPDGTLAEQLTRGVIAINLLQDGPTPFTYYPEWSLDDLSNEQP